MTASRKDPNKTRVLQLRVTDAELSALTNLAAKRGVTTSEYHRRLLREAVSHGTDFFPYELSELGRLTREIRYVGKNVNQITKAIHAGKITPDPVGLENVATARERIKEAIDILRKILLDSKKRRVRLRNATKP